MSHWLKKQSLEDNYSVNIILVGPPGAGKGTQGDKIVKKFNLYKVSAGDLLREEIKKNTSLGNKIKSKIDNGLLVSDDIIDNLIIKILSDRIFTIIELIMSSGTNEPFSIIDLILLLGLVLFLISVLSKSPVETLYRLKFFTILSPCVPFPAPGGPTNIIFTKLLSSKLCFFNQWLILSTH